MENRLIHFLSRTDAAELYTCIATEHVKCKLIKENISSIKVYSRWIIFKNILTHIQLTNKACKIVVFEIFGKNFACKSGLIVNKKPSSILQKKSNNSDG